MSIDSKDNEGLQSHFASPERSSPEEIATSLKKITNNPVSDAIMRTFFGVIAILNEHRQVISVNDQLLKMLGLENSTQALGLRIGELLECSHSHEEQAGCGTSRYCATCGAAIATVVSLSSNTTVERECVLNANRNGVSVDQYLLVQCAPIVVEDEKFLLLMLRDITKEQHRAVAERSFFHDMNNITLTLQASCSQLVRSENPVDTIRWAKIAKRASDRLAEEILIHKSLANNEMDAYQLSPKQITVAAFIFYLEEMFALHPASTGKILNIMPINRNISLESDESLLLRILTNMIINGLEASEPGQEVKLWVKSDTQFVTFFVSNSFVIPDPIALRIFQRNFSTKGSLGRGIGTFTMKLFGEKYLRGKVGFVSTEQDGTIFHFQVPKTWALFKK